MDHVNLVRRIDPNPDATPNSNCEHEKIKEWKKYNFNLNLTTDKLEIRKK